MGKIERYRAILEDELTNQANYKYSDMPLVQNQMIMNGNKNIFLLIVMGWHQNEYLHNLAFHIELKDEKIFIHEDRTETGIANELIEKGIPAEDIVMTYLQPPIKSDASLQRV